MSKVTFKAKSGCCRKKPAGVPVSLLQAQAFVTARTNFLACDDFCCDANDAAEDLAAFVKSILRFFSFVLSNFSIDLFKSKPN